MKRIATELKAKHPDIPLLVFPRGASYSIGALQSAGYDVITIDTKSDRKKSREILNNSFSENNNLIRPASLQGNFDVKLLQPESSVNKIETAVKIMLNDFGPQNLIANLGEGLLGKENPEFVNAFIESIHNISEELIKDKLKMD